MDPDIAADLAKYLSWFESILLIKISWILLIYHKSSSRLNLF